MSGKNWRTFLPDRQSKSEPFVNSLFTRSSKISNGNSRSSLTRIVKMLHKKLGIVSCIYVTTIGRSQRQVSEIFVTLHDF